MKTLDLANEGEVVTVSSVASDVSVLHRKLLTMGIVAGSSIEIIKKAPFAGPIAVKVCGTLVSLRVSEAQAIEIFELNNQLVSDTISSSTKRI